MDIEPALVRLLGDGRFHSGEAIAQSLGCSRTAVWKHVEALRGRGVHIEATAGRGYRMPEALELLDADAIRNSVSPDAANALCDLHVLDVTDSTNDRMLALTAAERHGVVILAEHQTAGRGRRGRSWVSPYARNLYLSLGWTFDTGAAELGCLPLVVALAACKALDRAGLEGHQVKWPNDLLLDGRKLGGCLVEIQGDASGPCFAVVGVGLNIRMPRETAETTAIDQPWIDLSEALPAVSRNRLAAGLANELLLGLERFAGEGFGPLQADWSRRDALAGKEVTLQLASGVRRGRALGVSPSGALRLQSDSGIAEYTAGEVSIRHRD